MAGANWVMLRIDDKDFPKIGRQILIFAQIINHLAHRPMFGHGDQLPLHQAAGGFLWIGQRLFNGGAIIGRQRAENGALIILLHILNNGDGIVGIEFGGDIGHLFGGQTVDQGFADIIIQLSNNIGINQVRQRPDKIMPRIARRLFDEIGNIRRVQGRDQRARAAIIAHINGGENVSDEFALEVIIFVKLRCHSRFGGAGDVGVAHRPSNPAVLDRGVVTPRRAD